MSNKRHFLLVFASLIVANVALYVVLSRNQAARLYPVDADSIVIPLFYGGFWSVVLMLIFVVAIFLPKNRLWGGIVSTVLFAIAAAIFALHVAYWAIPHHYEIAAAYGAVFLVFIGLAVGSVRQIFSNIVANRNAP